MLKIAKKSLKGNSSATKCGFPNTNNGFDIKDHTAIKSISKKDLILKKGYYLGNALNKLPTGIIDKRVTGIGATSLELSSKRNSIVVLPTKVLADQKARKGMLYVGSAIPKQRFAVTITEIKSYHQNHKGFRKILVVADSLWKVIDAIGPQVYSEYFLMIDEIDSYQSEILYRKQLENCFDFYYKFAERCLISATIRHFSDPKLKSESVYCFDQEDRKDIELSVIVASDILKTNQMLINSCIKRASQDKILVAINSVSMALKAAKILPKDLDCRILCSEKSRIKYSTEIKGLNGEIVKGRLPGKINFITSSYFTGIDIFEPVIVIMISDHLRPNTLLSSEKMKQIIGRSRAGVLKSYIISNPGATSSSTGSTQDIGNATDVILGFKSLVQATTIPEQCIREMKDALIKSDLPIRSDIRGRLCISYLQVDYAIQRQDIMKLHGSKKSLLNKLKSSGFKTSYAESNKLLTRKEKLIFAKSSSKKQLRYQESFSEFMKNVRSGQNGKTNGEFIDLLQGVYTQIWTLTKDTELTCNIMEEHFSKSYIKKRLDSILVSLRFRNLEGRIKSKLYSKFIKGKKYTAREIFFKLKSSDSLCVLGHVSCTLPNQKTAVATLKHFVSLKRTTRRDAKGPTSCYLIVDYNPLKIKSFARHLDYCDSGFVFTKNV